ncbi:uncharacterized protein LOC115545833 isoform X2 [Gadus morhua]|uniref:uncharacterized protein LOC115545833 isoform X2 n=1 Tax=Gadus morhua TaxID=8049 RepID=UPI0011B42F08|nr:uncharacterized protein LOC115545833 isoform X2 [Gadus morhua]
MKQETRRRRRTWRPKQSHVIFPPTSVCFALGKPQIPELSIVQTLLSLGFSSRRVSCGRLPAHLMETSARRVQMYTQDERRVIEEAVNAAIRALLDAMHRVNSDKIVKYQSVVEERDKEISRLEYKLRQNELELRVVRGQRDGYRRRALEGQGPSDEEHDEVLAGYEVPAGEDAMTNGFTVQKDFPSGSAERPPSLSSGDDPHHTGQPSPHHRHRVPRDASSCPPLSPGRRHSPRPPGARGKDEEEEEPSGCEAFFIKLEMCEQSCGSGQQDDRQQPDGPDHSPDHSRRLTDAQRNKRYRQRCRSTPEGLRACREKERIRYLKRRVLVAEMSEEARRRKREMWRAAARRHRDRNTMRPAAPLPASRGRQRRPLRRLAGAGRRGESDARGAGPLHAHGSPTASQQP